MTKLKTNILDPNIEYTNETKVHLKVIVSETQKKHIKMKAAELNVSMNKLLNFIIIKGLKKITLVDKGRKLKFKGIN